jgi:hypothetical protein
MANLDPALTVKCPECGAERNEPCISRHAISIHQARRRALTKLSRRADQILRMDRYRGVK